MIPAAAEPARRALGALVEVVTGFALLAPEGPVLPDLAGLPLRYAVGWRGAGAGTVVVAVDYRLARTVADQVLARHHPGTADELARELANIAAGAVVDALFGSGGDRRLLVPCRTVAAPPALAGVATAAGRLAVGLLGPPPEAGAPAARGR